MKTVFIHTKKAPRITVAAVINENTITFGASRCSPRDQFSRKNGRQRAQRRAETNPIKILNNVDESLNMRDISSICFGVARVVEKDPSIVSEYETLNKLLDLKETETV
jgi:hypothetical protein